MTSLPERSLAFCDLFEAELLLELMFRYWQHPCADDPEYRNHVLESAASVLAEAARGVIHIQDLPPEKMNLVAAVFYVERCAAAEPSESPMVAESRVEWLERVHRALPSCFCDPDTMV